MTPRSDSAIQVRTLGVHTSLRPLGGIRASGARPASRRDNRRPRNDLFLIAVVVVVVVFSILPSLLPLGTKGDDNNSFYGDRLTLRILGILNSLALSFSSLSLSFVR